MFIDYLRNAHADRSYRWILENCSGKHVAGYENEFSKLWEKVACICKAHGMDLSEICSPNFRPDDMLTDQQHINVLFLACLLRMADYCHFSRDRALPYVRESIVFESLKSEYIWREYADIDGVLITDGLPYFSVRAKCSDPVIQNAIIQQTHVMNRELVSQHMLLTREQSNHRYKYYYVDDSQIITDSSAPYIYSPAGFKVNYEKIVELLMSSKLYRNRLFSLREAIQNSLDALSVYKQREPDFSPYIVLEFKDVDGKPIIDIYDDGTGMSRSVCEQFFLSIASSSYWYTQACYRAWGDVKNSSLIASHGIGVRYLVFLRTTEITLYP